MADNRPIISISSDAIYALADRPRGAEKMSRGSDLQIAGQIIKSILADGSIGAGIAIHAAGEGK